MREYAAHYRAAVLQGDRGVVRDRRQELAVRIGAPGAGRSPSSTRPPGNTYEPAMNATWSLRRTIRISNGSPGRSTITVAALPYQVFHHTGSSLAVGLLGLAQLVPLLVFAIVGGALADSFDKRRMLLTVTATAMVCSTALAVNGSR